MQGISLLNNDPAEAVHNLIYQVINSHVNTCVPCEVVKVTKNKVDVKSMITPKNSNHPNVIYNNVVVMLPFGDKFKLTYPIKKGDGGILLTCKDDITLWKQGNGVPSKVSHEGKFNLTSSLFIPLWYNQNNLAKEEVTLEYKKNKVTLSDNKVTIQSSGDCEIKCNKVVNSQLKDSLDAIMSVFEAIENAGTTNPQLAPVVAILKPLLPAVKQQIGLLVTKGI